MTLGEKILSLRTARDMSQDDLAEKLEVSRQSVSKWETGQSTPDLDKIIRLADLFGVSVDELVREGERPRAVSEKKREKWELTTVQKIGLVFEAAGVVFTIIGLISEDWPLVYNKMAPLVVLSLPLLLAKKRPWLTLCWVLMALSFVFFRPELTAWGLLDGLYHLFWYFKLQYFHYVPYPFSRGDYSSYLFGGIVGIIRGLLLLALIVYTGYTCGKTWRETWKNRKKDG